MHLFLVFFILGVSAAAPIGPVGIEIIRRHLHHGFLTGVAFGAGACFSDLTYLVLLSIGILTFLNDPTLLNIIGMIGALIIAWFGYLSFKMASHFVDKNVKRASMASQVGGGYIMTLFNPYTILFWASVSAQVAMLGGENHGALILAGIGVLSGTFGWVIVLNCLLMISRRFVSDTMMAWINKGSAVILWIVACYMLFRSVMSI